jgi:hypothetical protein
MITVKQAMELMNIWVDAYDAMYEEELMIKAVGMDQHFHSTYIDALEELLDGYENRMGLPLLEIARRHWSQMRSLHHMAETNFDYPEMVRRSKLWQERLPGLINVILPSVPGPAEPEGEHGYIGVVTDRLNQVSTEDIPF